MKLVTVSVAPPGPPAVMVMTMSASFSLKMMRTMMAVSDTGSISGKMTLRKVCQAEAPSTRAASITSVGSACSPASSMIIMKGMKIQASSTAIDTPRDLGAGREEGRVLPAQQAREVGHRPETELQHRLADHPAHRHRRQHERQEEGHAEEAPSADTGR